MYALCVCACLVLTIMFELDRLGDFWVLDTGMKLSIIFVGFIVCDNFHFENRCVWN